MLSSNNLSSPPCSSQAPRLRHRNLAWEAPSMAATIAIPPPPTPLSSSTSLSYACEPPVTPSACCRCYFSSTSKHRRPPTAMVNYFWGVFGSALAGGRSVAVVTCRITKRRGEEAEVVRVLEIQCDVGKAKSFIRKMDLEARTLQPCVKASLLAKL
ncbi:hypothetical protein GUJ93_ZPchr0007g3155 [Zizania palustris]|uniref:Uncharacterized protein n=1 Tax=Zizania palustris TaxID=103762 RepID=A0A8J5VQD8_ZIZPA|nr:hypothetical protein GUJ93_ZPchr0007g3155 [Zizania palustris]